MDCLPEPVIPRAYFRLAISCVEDRSGYAPSVLGRLPREHATLFKYLTSFLGGFFLPRNPAVSPMDLAYVFAPILLKPDSGLPSDEEILRAAQFIASFFY